eukprot:scaffold12465_cov119-Isochrysis_galbana.AAC.3
MPTAIAPEPSRLSKVEPTNPPQTGLFRYVDRGAFTRGQAILMVPNIVFLAGMIYAYTIEIQPSTHRRPIILANTFTYFNVTLLFILSLALLPSIQSTMLHAQSAVKNAPAVGGRDAAIASAAKLGPEALNLLLFGALVVLVDFKEWWLWLSGVAAPIGVQLLLRATCRGTVNREYGRTGEGVFRYVEVFTRRMLVFVIFSIFSIVFTAVTSFGLPIVSMTDNNSDRLPQLAYCMQHINSVSPPAGHRRLPVPMAPPSQRRRLAPEREKHERHHE